MMQTARPIRGPLSRPSSKSKNSNNIRRLFVLVSLVALVALGIGIVLYLQVVQSVNDHHASNSNSNSPLVVEQPPNHKKEATVTKDDSLRTKQQHEDHNIKQNDVLLELRDPRRKIQETLVLTTNIGAIRITLRPNLSKESVAYIHAIVQQGCKRCNLYRAEKPGILQGIIEHKGKVPLAETKGSCPPGFESVANDCPEWDEHCACHGPVMTKGMVAWAAGDTGPDFFIDAYKNPADWWGTQHTVWGEILDEASFAVIDHIWSLPTNEDEGMIFLKTPIQFSLEITTTG